MQTVAVRGLLRAVFGGLIVHLWVNVCIGLDEAVRGHLIDPKTWDRIVENF